MSAQAFILEETTGERTNLLDHVGDGRWTVVLISRLDCVSCEEQKPGLHAFHEKYNDHLARVVVVSQDGLENRPEIVESIEKQGHSYKSLIGLTDVFHGQFLKFTGNKFRASPTFLIFDSSGNYYTSTFGILNLEELAQFMASNG